MITFTVFGIIFLALGIVLFIMSNEIQEISQRYDESCALNTYCTFQFTVNETIDQPVYFYYQLDNFYQNHRRYVKSRDYQQLKGQYKEYDDIGDCDPIKYNN
mmetsp:Transcript_22343/g.16810  ORF Transcript_22343/g.16810 Transcript_22343/m.16810 type:complete len:102 (+) Transcript_22343:137-442(+)|eukprot:CAMPEP_0202978264 /NCGR_PEP_ID=MMETSP1396-20130829/84747_1 /ASSEMBLY_ACC=CAM_ASM_000872 /TAXON_ID= /ORGANISM="Pseudokeronopsis sp., Strain Brazil" /LENGTH=101 /DNA_ID=CAMNT_0049717181 /DNA_START=137 /DNA_END=442 /DNA_ORIENTATION=+